MKITKYIGKDRNNYKITLEMEIEEKKKEAVTIDHKAIKTFKVLTISGGAWNYHRKDYDYCGQIYDELTPENIKALEKPMTWDKLNRIIEIWKEWHLNDLNPNCVHQVAFDCNIKEYKEQAKVQTKSCPLKYKYGSEWLVRLLPEEIEKEITELFS